jgi:surfactin synthase thioesterase subunit
MSQVSEDRPKLVWPEGTAQSLGGPPPAGPTSAPASAAQRQMWLSEQLDGGDTSYNVLLAFRLAGQCDVAALCASVGDLAARHEVLRTTLGVTGDQLVQVVRPPRCVPVPVTDLSALPADVRETRVRSALSQEERQRLDLEHGPVVRARVLVLGPREHVFLLTIHHVALDADSWRVIMDDFAVAYAARSAGRPPAFSPLPTTYRALTSAHAARLSDQRLAEQLAYWRDQLAGLPCLALTADDPPPGLRSSEGGYRRRELPAGIVATLRAVAAHEGGTLFDAFTAAVMSVLAGEAGQPDIAVGTTVSNRGGEPGARGVVGNFANTVVIRACVGEAGFPQLIRRVHEAAAAARRNCDVPFESVVQHLSPRRGDDRVPLFQVFSGVSDGESVLRLPGLAVSPILHDYTRSKFDLGFGLHVTDDGTAYVDCGFSADRYTGSTAEHLLTSLAGTLGALPPVGQAEPSQAAGPPAVVPGGPGIPVAEEQDELVNRIRAAWNEVLGCDGIGLDDNFFDLGGDSFAAVRAMFAIDDAMPVVQLFRTPTIRALAEAIRADAAAREGANSVLQVLTPPDRVAEVNLVCVPYGAGNAIVYQPLADALPETFALWSVNLPGHDPGNADADLLDIHEAADRCANAVLDQLSGPVIIYGHCAGSWLALRLAQRLEQAGSPVAQVYLAASLPHPDPEQALHDERHTTDEEWVAVLRSLGGFEGALREEDRSVIMRAGRNDHIEAMRFQIGSFATPPRPLRAPIHTIFGDRDTGIDDHDTRYREWELFGTVDGFSVIPGGGHYFVAYQARAVAELLSARHGAVLPL